MKEISVEGCSIIGRGGQGVIYRLDEETIVKLYNPGYSLEAINRERESAKAVHSIVDALKDEDSVLHGDLHPETEKAAPGIIDHLCRKIVLPNADTVKYLLQTL